MIIDIEAEELSIIDKILLPNRIMDIIVEDDTIHVELENGMKLSYKKKDTILVQVVRGF